MDYRFFIVHVLDVIFAHVHMGGGGGGGGGPGGGAQFIVTSEGGGPSL